MGSASVSLLELNTLAWIEPMLPCSQASSQEGLKVEHTSKVWSTLLIYGAGPTQHLCILAMRVLLDTDSVYRSMNLKWFFKALFFSITVGMIPGGIWQLVFVADITMKTPVAVGALMVAVGVALGNLFVGKVADWKLDDPAPSEAPHPLQRPLLINSGTHPLASSL